MQPPRVAVVIDRPAGFVHNWLSNGWRDVLVGRLSKFLPFLSGFFLTCVRTILFACSFCIFFANVQKGWCEVGKETLVVRLKRCRIQMFEKKKAKGGELCLNSC